MKYPVVVHHEKDTSFGVTVPDIPGCFSAGESFEDALTNTVEAIESHFELLAEDAAEIPKANSIDSYFGDKQFKKGIWGFVEVDLTPYMGKREKINVTLPTSLIHKIDVSHSNRSKFLAEAAIKALG